MDAVRSFFSAAYITFAGTPEERARAQLTQEARNLIDQMTPSNPDAAINFLSWLISVTTVTEDEHYLEKKDANFPRVNGIVYVEKNGEVYEEKKRASYQNAPGKLKLLEQVFIDDRGLTEALALKFHFISDALNGIYATANERFKKQTAMRNSYITVDQMIVMKSYVNDFKTMLIVHEVLNLLVTHIVKVNPAKRMISQEMDDRIKNFVELDLFKTFAERAMSSKEYSPRGSPVPDLDPAELDDPTSKYSFLQTPCGIGYFHNVQGKAQNIPEKAQSAPNSPSPSLKLQEPRTPVPLRVASLPLPSPQPANADSGDLVSMFRQKGYAITWINHSNMNDSDKMRMFFNGVGLATLRDIFDRGIFNRELLQDYLVDFLTKNSLENFSFTKISPPADPESQPSKWDVLKGMVVYQSPQSQRKGSHVQS